MLAGELLSAWLRWTGTVAIALAAVSVLASLACRRTVAALPLACIASAALGLWLASRSLEPTAVDCFLPEDAGSTKLWIEAEILDAPSRVEGGIRVLTDASVPGRDPERVCGSVLLTLAEPPGDLAVGERVRVHASLRRPRNCANPRAYDYRGTLARRGIWVTAHGAGQGMSRLERTGKRPG